MSATAQHLINQIADGRFPLRKLLGVSPNSAVFLTSATPPRPRDPSFDAAIKLIPEDPSNSEVQLDRWRDAAALSHPGLLRILHFGRCAIDGSPCLYVVTELADEDLGQLLPRRALTPDETRGVLAAVLPALDFLHENGFVHAGLKPSNIHATGDNIKLSADRILPAGKSSSAWPLAAPFAAPESILFPASDIWSLGISLCETLANTLPARESSGQFALPELPAPFSEIVRSALVEDATLRVSLDQVRSLLDPSFVAKRNSAPAVSPGTNDLASPDSNLAAVDSPYVRRPESPDSPESLIAAAETPATASASSSPCATTREPLPQIDPLAIPLSPVSPPARSPAASNIAPRATRARIPVSSLPQVNATIGTPRRVSAPPVSARSNKLVLVSIAAAIILLGLFVPRYFLRSRNASSSNSANPSATSSAPEVSPAPARKIPATSTGPASISVPSNSSPSSKSGAASSSPATSSPKNSSAANSDGSISTTAAPNTNSRTSAANSSPTSGGATSASRSSSNTNPPPSPAASSPAAPATHSPSSDVDPVSPAVVHKILPEVSAKARSTIRGTVRINVRVHLNPDGTVSTAELANPAPSQFFANLALKAARQWQFAPPPSSSGSISSGASSTVIRFDFMQTATSAYLP
jgi:TonB family protein